MNAPAGVFAIVVALAGATLAAPLTAEHPAIARAESAVESGRVDPARDLGPLLAALRSAKSVDEKRELVGAIADLGESDGESPNAVKEYLATNAPPLLLEVIRTGANAFLLAHRYRIGAERTGAVVLVSTALSVVTLGVLLVAFPRP